MSWNFRQLLSCLITIRWSNHKPSSGSFQPNCAVQTDEHRAELLVRYGPEKLFQAERNFNAAQDLDVSIQEGDLVGVIKQQDPMGSNSRWLIDNGGRLSVIKYIFLPNGHFFSTVSTSFVFQSLRGLYTVPSSNPTTRAEVSQTCLLRANLPMSLDTEAPHPCSPAKTATAPSPSARTRLQSVFPHHSLQANLPHTPHWTRPHHIGVIQGMYPTLTPVWAP